MAYLSGLILWAAVSGGGHLFAFYCFAPSNRDEDGELSLGPIVIGAIMLIITNSVAFGTGTFENVDWVTAAQLVGAFIGGSLGLMKGDKETQKNKEKEKEKEKARKTPQPKKYKIKYSGDEYYKRLVNLNGCGPKTAEEIVWKVKATNKDLTAREKNIGDQVQ